MFFLVFVTSLRNRLRSVEPEPKTLSAVVFGTGITSAALFVGAVSLFVGTAFAAEQSEFVVDPNVARFADATGYLVLVGSVMVMSALVAATSVLALRTSVLPRWLGWAGVCVSVLLLAAVTFVPIFLLWLWIVVVSVVLIMRTPTSHSQERASTAT